MNTIDTILTMSNNNSTHIIFILNTFLCLVICKLIVSIYDNIMKEMYIRHYRNLEIINSLKKEIKYYKKFQYLPRRRSERLNKN
jgi:hypothetical protein